MHLLEPIKSFIAVFFLFSVLGCNLKERSKVEQNTTATGEITITADDGLMPIVDAEVNVFEAIYSKAKINVEYGSEAATINKLLNQEVRLAIATRPLTKGETDDFREKHKIDVKNIKIGTGALALIINRNNPDTAISYEQVQGLLRGEITTWKQINNTSPLKDVSIVFDNNNAASIRYLKDSVAKVNKLPTYAYAVDSNQKVIDYVAVNENAIGVIGVSWISDRDDTTTTGFLKRIKVMAVSKRGQAEYHDEYYQPYQAYIATGEYPFIQNIYILNAEPGIRLGSGFTAFVAGDKGQRVILKSGLVPATMPVRIVRFNKSAE